jgi:hypothetical protein
MRRLGIAPYLFEALRLLLLEIKLGLYFVGLPEVQPKELGPVAGKKIDCCCIR